MDRPLTIGDVMSRLPVKVSERTLRSKIREVGCYLQIGKAIMLTEADYAVLLESMRPCHSRSSKGRKARTGISHPSPVCLLPL